MVMEAWPSISETTFALTPSLKSSVVQVYLRSWRRKSSRTPERALMRLKEQLRRFEAAAARVRWPSTVVAGSRS